MIIKRYIVKDMNEAMVRIRYELGKDAIIVSNRWIRQKGIKNIFKKKVLEVTAAIEENRQTKPIHSQSIKTDVLRKEPQVEEEKDISIKTQEPIQEIKEVEREEKTFTPKEMAIEKELTELKEMVYQLIQGNKEKQEKENPENYHVEPIYTNSKQDENILNNILETMELDEEIIEGFTGYCIENNIYSNINQDVLYKYFEEMIDKNIEPKAEIHEKIWVLIGPTGVGKTTTIAKIAARESINKGKMVGLITLDTYRIGAVDQLKTYANILNIPIEVVLNQSELVKAIENLKDCDLILIDSTGRSSLNIEQLNETKMLLKQVQNKKNILVVSATTRSKDLKEILKNYHTIGYEYLIVTKTDETQCYGNLLNISHYSKKPILYITTGQSVPDDIQKVSKENLMKFLSMEVDI